MAGLDGFVQKKVIGLHGNILPTTVQAPYATTTPRRRKQHLWKHHTGKIRKYCIRIETLMAMSVREYIQRFTQNACDTD
jgi:hypothetical protein